jgi:hypothetical protein
MTADGLAAVLLGEPHKSPLICVPTRPKHQHRQARMLEFGVPFQETDPLRICESDARLGSD